jgi:hypothetical protein
MISLRVIISLIALAFGGWLAVDGSRALLKGDYFTPSSGTYAGRLGSWANIVTAVGLNPRSLSIKIVHISLGFFWLVALILFWTKPSVGWFILTGCSVFSFWYLPIGTVLCLVELVLLFLPYTRSLR